MKARGCDVWGNEQGAALVMVAISLVVILEIGRAHV